MKIYIEDIADKMEEADDNWEAYLNLKTGEIVDVGVEYHSLVEELEEDEEIPNRFKDWEKEFIETALEVEENWGDYVKLPDKFAIHEYSIMEDFIDSVKNDRKRTVLYDAISGRGAFRRFKDKVYDMGLEEIWFAFKFKAYCKIARRWCEEHQIEYAFKEEKNRG